MIAEAYGSRAHVSCAWRGFRLPATAGGFRPLRRFPRITIDNRRQAIACLWLKRCVDIVLTSRKRCIHSPKR